MKMAHKPPQNPRTRRLNPCHRHPNIPTTTGLCAPCLRDRLSLLNPTAGEASTSAAGEALPELRRCKSFSVNNSVGLSGEPRRRSCDVRARSSLSTLFHIDDGGVNDGDLYPPLKVESRNLRLLSKGTCPVPEVREEEESDCEVDVARVSGIPEIDCEIDIARVSGIPESDCEIDVARVSDIPESDCEIDVARVSNCVDLDEFEEAKTMKEFIDLECQAKTDKTSNRKDFKEIAGSFWVAASVFSKKLRKWRKKEGTRRDISTLNADGHGVDLGEMRLDRLRGRRLRDTQSEVGEYGFGRRSCDADPRASVDLGRASMDVDAFGRRSCDSDPRFSIDLGRASIDCGRISVDEAQCSLDAPRASWDGYLMGGRTLSRGATPMVSVIENAMATVYGFDHRMLGEGKMKVENRVERDSKRVHRMKEQYLDNSVHLHKQRKSTDQCNFLKKDMDMVVVEDEEPKLLSNAKVSPAAIDMFDGSKLLFTEKELNDWRLNSLKDDSSESFETASKDFASVSSSSNGKVFKKCRQWSKLWNVWGLLNRRKGEKYGDEERLERGKAECSRSASSYNNRSNINGAPGFDQNPKLIRSHSTSSSRGSSSIVGSASGMISRTESKALVRRKKENVFERNRSARFSPNHVDNGLLRFYLTPLRSRRQTKPGKTRLKKSHSLARSVLRL